MASFITNLFPSANANKQENKHEGILPVPPPPLHTRASQIESSESPGTPIRHNFITPVSTPQGSPSKNRNPPGANDLPTAFESSMRLAPSPFGSPSKLGRGTGSPLAPGKGNALAVDDSYFGRAADESVVHKSASPGSPLRKQGKENTPPSARMGTEPAGPPTLAALSRQELYQPRGSTPPTQRKYNTQRGLTSEELEILNKPNVKRLANVTQLCKFSKLSLLNGTNSIRLSGLLLRSS
jgi:cell cycle protein kinase DBF2